MNKKPRPMAGGVVRVQAMPLDQRTQLTDAPPRKVVVVDIWRGYLSPWSKYRRAFAFRQAAKPDRQSACASWLCPALDKFKLVTDQYASHSHYQISEMRKASTMAERIWSVPIQNIAAFTAMLALVAASTGPARAADPPGFLGTIHRHMTRTSTVTDNGDLNPYGVVVAPVSAGRIQKDDVLIDNFNDISNLQGTGTTIITYRPSTKKRSLFAKLPQNSAQCPWRGRTDDGNDDAQSRLGHRRQHAEQRRDHPHQGQWLPAGA
jgi:hypothetical protein